MFHSCKGDGGVRVTFETVPKADAGLLKAVRSHYPKSKSAPVGPVIAWVVEERGKAIGHLILSAPALNLSCRRRVGVGPRFEPGTACVSMFKLKDRRWRVSAASTVLCLWHAFALLCWRKKYGEWVTHLETFVDPRKIREKENPGACFKRAGYRTLGRTRGFRRVQDSNGEGPWYGETSPKLVLYRGPLPRVPVAALRAKDRELCTA